MIDKDEVITYYYKKSHLIITSLCSVDSIQYELSADIYFSLCYLLVLLS